MYGYHIWSAVIVPSILLSMTPRLPKTYPQMYQASSRAHVAARHVPGIPSRLPARHVPPYQPFIDRINSDGGNNGTGRNASRRKRRGARLEGKSWAFPAGKRSAASGYPLRR